jgi:hypothetical protein
MAQPETGVILIVLGVVLMIGSIFTFFLFLPICGLGIVLLIIGIVMVATNRPAPPYYAAPYGAPMAPPQAYPPQPPAPGQPAPAAPYQQPACYVCGSPLTWVAQYGRWYCSRCQTYR